MSKPTALHNEGTAPVSERLNISDTPRNYVEEKVIVELLR